MARIAGVNLPNKRIVIALTYIYGIGPSISRDILVAVGVDENVRVADLSEDQLNDLRLHIESIPTEGDLRQKVAADIRRLKEIACYRGRRHNMGLPVRGQKTKVNCRTRKGKKRTVANKKG